MTRGRRRQAHPPTLKLPVLGVRPDHQAEPPPMLDVLTPEVAVSGQRRHVRVVRADAMITHHVRSTLVGLPVLALLGAFCGWGATNAWSAMTRPYDRALEWPEVLASTGIGAAVVILAVIVLRLYAKLLVTKVRLSHHGTCQGRIGELMVFEQNGIEYSVLWSRLYPKPKIGARMAMICDAEGELLAPYPITEKTDTRRTAS